MGKEGGEVEIHEFPFRYHYYPRECTGFILSNPRTVLTLRMSESSSPIYSSFFFFPNLFHSR